MHMSMLTNLWSQDVDGMIRAYPCQNVILTHWWNLLDAALLGVCVIVAI
jgi:hypothetical protein